MTEYNAMQQLPQTAGYKTGDVLVLAGELFGRGYANGLIDEAKRIGMTVIGMTVGRRDTDGSLRPLTPEELSDAEANLGGKIINVPMEAGFDMEQPDGLPSIAEQLKKARPDDWKSIKIDPDFISKARDVGTTRFREALKQIVQQLMVMIPPGANVLISHTMAGGIPRARVFMPLLNRIFKGTGDKYLPSAEFWDSNLGHLCDVSFNEVTADTFRYLIEETTPLRERNTAAGARVNYSAYGYHGTEVLLGDEFVWQSYTPYIQGWAKIRLEDIAAEASKKGITAAVFNCPEIQTNSSALFLGVEISLYPLLKAIREAVGVDVAEPLFARCRSMLKQGETLENLLEKADNYLSSPAIKEMRDFASWPHHNTKAQAELMLAASLELMGMHSDQKQLICAELSKTVFRSTGRLIAHASWNPPAPAVWLTHKVIANLLADKLGEGLL